MIMRSGSGDMMGMTKATTLLTMDRHLHKLTREPACAGALSWADPRLNVWFRSVSGEMAAL